MLFRQIKTCFYNKTIGYLIATRGIQQSTKISSTQFLQVEIDVPWGKIDGKLWGSKDKQPILAIHGWLDNAGTFDLLAPLLENSTILAIDLPGHGSSSWLPRGIPYDDNLYVMTMRLIAKYFGWNKMKLLGHSMGGLVNYIYASLYPDETEFVVSIDSLSSIATDINKFSIKRAKAIDQFINFEKKVTDSPPSYSEDEIIERWINAAVFNSMDIPSTKILMKRGAKRKEDGTYFYTRDYRLSIEGFTACRTNEDIKHMTERITCPYFVLRASQLAYFKTNNYWKIPTDILSKTSKDFCIFDLEGCHHIHMVQPEMVASKINEFLAKHDV